MTAIVGVMNKHAVALAADSAVTIAGRKVMNSANKIFALSKYHPVAVAIYGSAELIGTPWEIIIKEFRKSLKSTSYPTLRMYVDAFFDFIKSKNYYTTIQEADSYLIGTIAHFTKTLLKHSTYSLDKALADIQYLKNNNGPLCISYDTSDEQHLDNIISFALNDVDQSLKSKGITIDIKCLKQPIKELYLKTVTPVEKAGLIFTGYGEDEYFPSLINREVSSVINNKLSVGRLNTSVINKDNPSSICPFAQTDVMQTILDGIAPQVHDVYAGSLEHTFSKIIEALVKVIEPGDPGLAHQIANIDITPFKTSYLKLSIESRRQKYTAPFVGSVAGLEKEDLADFAESLIKLTSIKRKVSLDQDSVGGPTDVMLISKGDGIIWKHRKHYFDRELNHHFFENYFND